LIRRDGKVKDWQMTTDLVLVTREPGSRPELLAVSVKYDDKDLTPRQLDLLYKLEKQYWTFRNVTWILVTRNQYTEAVGFTLRRSAPWALGVPVGDRQLAVAVETALRLPDASLTRLIKETTFRLGDEELAKRALWQAVWCGLLPF
jgi:hypothetical protein